MKKTQKRIPEEQEIHILICLSASPNNQNVIRTAARFAHGNSRKITALYVDNGKVRRQDPVLRRNMDLAENLGAELVTVDQKDIVSTIIDYADKMAVTDLFIGYSGPSKGGTLLQHLSIMFLISNILNHLKAPFLSSLSLLSVLPPSSKDNLQNGKACYHT